MKKYKIAVAGTGYVGLSIYYDLENLIKVVEKIKVGTKTTDGREVVFAFVGAGSVLDKLVLYVKEHHMDNVTFIPYQDKADLIYSLNAGDVHWCVNAKQKLLKCVIQLKRVLTKQKKHYLKNI